MFVRRRKKHQEEGETPPTSQDIYVAKRRVKVIISNIGDVEWTLTSRGFSREDAEERSHDYYIKTRQEWFSAGVEVRDDMVYPPHRITLIKQLSFTVEKKND